MQVLKCTSEGEGREPYSLVDRGSSCVIAQICKEIASATVPSI